MGSVLDKINDNRESELEQLANELSDAILERDQDRIQRAQERIKAYDDKYLAGGLVNCPAYFKKV